MKLLYNQVLVLPDNSDEPVSPGGIIIPSTAKRANSNMKAGVIVSKGTGTPWEDMSEFHVKRRIMWRNGAGTPHEEQRDGMMVKYLILSCEEVWFV